ncbi:Yip1 family protein [Desulfitibacter alkalitolerans]|uniref:Yip1 family protein n=1 Tax=Desulfitibacter alkalitolerans TaxID=264641 RepID=UPI00048753D0|nr:Yip1 family protein [Desulfitibacter alkalitolerans]
MTEEKENREEITKDEIKNIPLGEQIESGPDAPEVKDALEIRNPQPGLGSEETEDRLSLVEILYGTVASPNETFARLVRKPPVIKSVLTVIVIYIFTWLLNLSHLKKAGFENLMVEEFGQISGQLLGNIFIVMGFLGIIFVLLTWFVISGSLNLWASLLGGRDNAKGLFALYGFAMLPGVFSEVLQTLINLLGLPGAINWLIVIFTFIWILYLQMIAIKTTQGLSTGLSLFAALTPILVMGLLMIFTALLVLAAFLPVYQNFFNI